ncbi:hypothetical protein MYCTH_2119855 [Thermothelomyces thermophilus ATCC 42464]|uniref:Heterokaryon incompatibility domain-containing protein n=1 Tax=Thermothelomyces thermophilus (strain ATCC 42464 / BCRC 31852 / DSM 1799) TaxID=573729 RepID=G2QJG3_THET4|nr:uncharacterized protein MYCTH_2119855 [Thermothelomyces thermophilus ATCC 42464]AEO59720.1 hypothetical protein MYCTH_2119855 [Thermothelomyces thermophilus ATCC 42464]
MRRFFRRHRKTSAKNDDLQQKQRPTMSLSIKQLATTPGSHMCTSTCQGISGLPPEYHEFVIAQLTQRLGATPEKLMIEGFAMSNVQTVPGQGSDVVSEPELLHKRAIEGNTEFARMPLPLSETYRYPPLATGHARFLRLGRLGSHPLACLESHSLESPPPYIAISYCRGSTSAQRGLVLDMQGFSVSETVLEVLNQVQAWQHATRSNELLWIDQICINQSDYNEKLDQMYRMGDIYYKAEKVFIWLGPAANQSDLAISNMKKMLGEVMALNQATATRADAPNGITAARINEIHGQLYGHLFLRPWFRCLWTVQETLLARRLVVMCGNQEVDLVLLAELATQILTYGSLDIIQFPGACEEDLTNALVAFVNLYTLRDTDVPTGQMLHLSMSGFRDLVSEARSRQCTMAPDRVHALMGVAPPRIREYMAGVCQNGGANHRDIWHLYTHFTKCMLDNDSKWRFLSSAPSRDRPTELPSWVPNLDSQPPFASKLSGDFSAGISSATRHLVDRTVSAEELVARGFRLDVVAEIVPQTAFTEAAQNTRHNEVYGDAAREWEQACLRLCQRVYGLGPEQLPRLHIDILLAQSSSSAARPALGSNGGGGGDGDKGGDAALEAYHLFWAGCRLRNEALRQIREGGFPVPEHLSHLPDAAERFADRAVRAWRNALSADEYALLLGFTSAMKAACSGRPYISTRRGLLGLGCPGVQAGDVVCILYGTTVPYVLRPRPDGAMSLVGDAYIHGAMDGEALAWPDKEPGEMIRIR